MICDKLRRSRAADIKTVNLQQYTMNRIRRSFTLPSARAKKREETYGPGVGDPTRGPRRMTVERAAQSAEQAAQSLPNTPRVAVPDAPSTSQAGSSSLYKGPSGVSFDEEDAEVARSTSTIVPPLITTTSFGLPVVPVYEIQSPRSPRQPAAAPSATSARSSSTSPASKSPTPRSGGRKRANTLGAAIGGVKGAIGSARPANLMKGMKRGVLTSLQKRVDKKLKEMYTSKIKLSVTADRRFPWQIRCAVHEIVDEVWFGLHNEVIRTFEKMIEGPGDADMEEEEGQDAAKPVVKRASTTSLPSSSNPPSPPPSPPEESHYGCMKIVLVSASNLIAADKTGTSDPYAVLKFGGKKKKSKVIKKTLNPVWNEELEFLGEKAKMGLLEIELFDKDKVGRDDKLGNATVDLSSAIDTPNVSVSPPELTLSTQGGVTIRATFVPRPPQIKGGDDLDLGEDDPENIDGTITTPKDVLNGTLRIRLLSASSLVSADANGLSDPYVKLIVNGKEKRSSIVKKSLNPEWGTDEDVFEWSGAKKRMDQLEVVVMDWDRLGKHDRLGSAILSLKSQGVFMDGAGQVPLEAVLNTKGTVSLKADWRSDASMNAPDAAEANEKSEEVYLEEFDEDENDQPFSWELIKRRMPWERVRRDYSKISVRVTIESGRGLLAADVGGTSDPYVKLQIAGEEFMTKTIRKTVNPDWDESFTIEGHQVCMHG